MKKAIIFYRSRTGITRNYADEIAHFLKTKDMEVKVINVLDYDQSQLEGANLILLGCWTHGLMFFAQHPDKAWKEFAKQLPALNGKIIGLFTTYKAATGSMFKKMKKCLKNKVDKIDFELKSKTGELIYVEKNIIEEAIKDW